MRNVFAQELTRIAKKNSKIVLLSGDIGNRLFDQYKEETHNRFYNCGIAEANMTGVAAGLALSGFHPITYTITPFATVRCLEQIRVDLCYHNLPSIIVGTGAGLSYAQLGPTHHSCEDIALLRLLPNMTVICPADPVEVRLALRAALQHKGPVYLRLGKKGEPSIHQDLPDFKIGKSINVEKGDDVCLLSTGNTLSLVLRVAEQLEKKGISTRVESFHTVKPLDENVLNEVFKNYKIVGTIEEHSLIGGFGAAVAEWFVDQSKTKATLLRFGTDDRFLETVGSQDYAREELGLSVKKVTKKILSTYQ